MHVNNLFIPGFVVVIAAIVIGLVLTIWMILWRKARKNQYQEAVKKSKSHQFCACKSLKALGVNNRKFDFFTASRQLFHYFLKLHGGSVMARDLVNWCLTPILKI